MYPTGSAKHLQRMVPPLVKALQDLNIRVKYAAERALRHLLDGGSAASVTAFESGAAAAGNGDLVKFVRDYSRNTLSRMSAESDQEGDKW